MQTAKFLRRRRFLLALPILAAPSLTLLFIALGGGKAGIAPAEGAGIYPGINLRLPDAHFKKTREKDKLEFYEQSKKDSVKWKEDIKNNPFFGYSFDSSAINNEQELQNLVQQSALKYKPRETVSLNRKNDLVKPAYGESEETKLIQGLTKLKNRLDGKEENLFLPDKPPAGNPVNPELEKIRQMMSSFKQEGESQPDPEIKQIDQLLQKMIEVERPRRLEDSLIRASCEDREEALPVSLFNEQDSEGQNGFYGLCADTAGISETPGILAIIGETETLTPGSLVKMRLSQDICIGGRYIPRRQLIYGVTSMASERMKISVSSIRIRSEILPVSLEAYDLDGLEGIYIPGSMTRDVAKESAGDVLSPLGTGGLDPSIGAQAANAGFQAAKTLMSRKTKQLRVRVKEGYQLILKENNRK